VFDVKNTLLLLSLSLPVVILVSAYKGLVYGNLFNVIVATISAYTVYLGMGAFTINDHIDNVINYNIFVLAHISLTLTIGTLLEERKRYTQTLEEKVAFEVQKSQEQQLLIFQQSRLAQMGEMISMIAHQWRQPLNNLALSNQLLLSKYAKNRLDDKVMEYFKTNSKKQIDLMSETIDNFRDFFKQDDKESSFYLDDAMKKVLGVTADIYQHKKISIQYSTPQNYQLYGSANALEQVILNIINNAKDALVENSIENKRIHITLANHDNHTQIMIQDNAGGIPEEIIDKIFDPYFSTKSDSGTGLGLYMSKIIVENYYKGHLCVSNSEKGALFSIVLS